MAYFHCGPLRQRWLLSIVNFYSLTMYFLSLQSLLRRFTKRELLNDVTPLQMARLDVTNEQSRVHPSGVDIDIGAEAVIKVLWNKSCVIRL